MCNWLTETCLLVASDDDIRVVNTPPFAESVTEGDVRWEKGNTCPCVPLYPMILIYCYNMHDVLLAKPRLPQNIY